MGISRGCRFLDAYKDLHNCTLVASMRSSTVDLNTIPNLTRRRQKQSSARCIERASERASHGVQLSRATNDFFLCGNLLLRHLKGK